MCFHRGYYSTENTEVMTTYLTAQFFASFGKKRISRKKWNARTDFYEGKQMLPELLHDLTLDLQVNWDDHYSATRFPPSRMYKNAKIDTQSNHLIHRIDFDRLRHVHTLVDTFEKLYPALQMETVWFIKKSLRGDGFQWWHHDLNGNGTVVATIVLTLDAQPMNQQCLSSSPSSSSSSLSSSTGSLSLLSYVKQATTLVDTVSVQSKKKASPVMYKKTMGFTYEDDRDGDYTPRGRGISRGNSPKRSSRKGSEPERSSPRLRAKANRVVSAVEGGTKDNNVDSDERKTPSEEDEGDSDKGIALSDMAEGTQDNAKGMQDTVNSEELMTPYKEADGESDNGAVSDMAEEMQDNAYSDKPNMLSEDAEGEIDNVEMIQHSPIGETFCRHFLEMKRKETLEALNSQRGVAEAEVLPEDDEKTLINSMMVAAEAEAGRGSADSISIERDTLDDNAMDMTDDDPNQENAEPFPQTL